MKKIILITGLLTTLFNVNAQQNVPLGIVHINKKDKEVPVDYWYVMNGKQLKNHMYYYNLSNLTMDVLKNMLSAYGQSSETPFGKDEKGDSYWIITHPTGNIVYIYYQVDGDSGYSSIISVTR